MDNREAAVRVPSNPHPPSPTHFELKTVDASANPYLAMGAVIAAGLDGIQQRREPGEPVAVDPATLTEAERQSRQIDRLPANLGEAIAHLHALWFDGRLVRQVDRESGVYRFAVVQTPPPR